MLTLGPKEERKRTIYDVVFEAEERVRMLRRLQAIADIAVCFPNISAVDVGRSIRQALLGEEVLILTADYERKNIPNLADISGPKGDPSEAEDYHDDIDWRDDDPMEGGLPFD